MEFRFTRPNVQWIVATLQSVNTKHLQKITIFSSVPLQQVREEDRREWQSLDHLLVQLWVSRSIIPKIKYTKAPEWMGGGEAAPNLFPELVNRGVEREVGDYSELAQSLISPP